MTFGTCMKLFDHGPVVEQRRPAGLLLDSVIAISCFTDCSLLSDFSLPTLPPISQPTDLIVKNITIDLP